MNEPAAFHGFDRLASTRGEGLLPELRALLESRAVMEAGERVVPPLSTLSQAGPDPRPRAGTSGGNVLKFVPRAATLSTETRNAAARQ